LVVVSPPGDAATHRDDAREDLLAFASFPHEAWRQIWSNNPQERLNKESAAAPTSSVSSRFTLIGQSRQPVRRVRSWTVGSCHAVHHGEWG
jgi:hypothetical protein